MPRTLGLILAAGFGSRLGHDMPKCLIAWPGPPLVPGNEGTIVDHQLQRLRSAGIEDVWIVVGFQAERVRKHLAGAKGVHFVDNPDYMDTNTAKSMLMGLEAMPDGDVVALNGDVVFDDGIIQSLLSCNETALAVDPRVCGDEEIKYRIRDGRLQELSKRAHGEGEAVGINRFHARDRTLLVRALRHCETTAYFERAVEWILPFVERPVRLVAVPPKRAMEIDFPEDLEAARRAFS